MFMPIVDYTPKLFGDVSEMVSQFPGPINLAHRPFVDYYYATRESSKLYLYYSDSGKVIGTLGRELTRFEYNSRELTIRIGSNWYSLQQGVGGELSRHSAQSNPDSTGLMFSASQDTLAILRHHNWTFMPGIRGYFLNNPCSLYPGESIWRSAAKSLLRRVARRSISSFAPRIPSQISAEVTVREEGSYAPDLLPSRSPFIFRFAPDAEYLSWRYNLALPFIRYRLFRAISRGVTAGYVILRDSPQEIIVAQCDGEDAAALAYGVLLSVLELGRKDQEPRTVFLACCHSEMEKIFQAFGFREQRGGDIPFAFRTRPPHVDLSPGASHWLVNFDWGDNGVRPPFRDQGSNRNVRALL
jgi:hypothetical protein